MPVSSAYVSIVDDDRSVRVATAGLLESFGLEVATFPDAQSLLDWDGLDQVKCVISDIQMPGLSGLELQQALTASGRRCAVIFITAFPDPAISKKAEKAGAFAFLSKPFDGDHLYEIVARVLKSH